MLLGLLMDLMARSNYPLDVMARLEPKDVTKVMTQHTGLHFPLHFILYRLLGHNLHINIALLFVYLF